MKIVTVIGARPQFIKAAAVSPVLRRLATEVIVHTGQHYDANMSDAFFSELELPQPQYNLGIGSGTHGFQTGRILEKLDEVLAIERPDWVLVYGDTNSTLAGALSAAKLHVRVAHVEAGLRSFNRLMPEEINRVLTDHTSDLLLAPTEGAISNLVREGLADRSLLVGDVMVDILFRVGAGIRSAGPVLERWGVQPKGYALLTIHRPSNVDDAPRLQAILRTLSAVEQPVLFPIHPRTLKRIGEFGLSELLATMPFRPLEPLGYREMLVAEANANRIITDSGGVQKEAYILNVPCITLRDETEWVETVSSGWNVLAGEGLQNVLSSSTPVAPEKHPAYFGDGHAGERIVDLLCRGCENSTLEPTRTAGASLKERERGNPR